MGGAIDVSGINVIVGTYGSGKTEVTINLALHAKASGKDVAVADLDLVNPYFRTREVRLLLAQKGIDLVLPPPMYLNADLPILTPAVSGLIRAPRELTILDLGGEGVGVTVLAALADSLAGRQLQVWQVINPNRPGATTADGCREMQAKIERSARLSVTGYIGNAHMMADTTVADIMAGYRFCRDLADAAGKPLAFVTAPAHLLPALDTDSLSCPVLAIYRQLVPPWLAAVPMGEPHSG
ncbi:MAG: cobalamin biosynthesis protein CbiA [Pseudomonadota bacterium]